MQSDGPPGYGKKSAGVLDAGVVLTRLDRRRRSHQDVTALFNRCAGRDVRLVLSMVNLAEVLQHSGEYAIATGLDPVTFLRGFNVELHSPNVSVARKVAELAAIDDLSLADRFAMATAQILGIRLYTTDPIPAQVFRRRKLPVTKF